MRASSPYRATKKANTGGSSKYDPRSTGSRKKTETVEASIDNLLHTIKSSKNMTSTKTVGQGLYRTEIQDNDSVLLEMRSDFEEDEPAGRNNLIGISEIREEIEDKANNSSILQRSIDTNKDEIHGFLTDRPAELESPK